MRNKLKRATTCRSFFLYNENHAIVAWFKRGLTDEQKVNKRDKKYFEKGSFEKGDSPARGNVACDKRVAVLQGIATPASRTDKVIL